MHTILRKFYLLGKSLTCNLWCGGNKKSYPKNEIAFYICGAEWTRTTDSRIFSPMLYHLSYSTDQ